jgi:hypothetical protein
MTLTTPQLQTLKAAIAAETNPTFVGYRTNGQTGLMADWFNGASAFVVWRTNVASDEIGNAWVGTDIDGMSALNMQRLQLLLASSRSGVFDMSRADRRAGFENPFGANQNNASRVAMRAVWKRLSTRFERLFVTGTGTDDTPGLLVVEGEIDDTVIIRALAL